MNVDVDTIPLIAFLRTNQPELYGKAKELRSAVTGWLAYIPETFPHYTRHTVEHSDEILIQASKLLFADINPLPVVDLSPIEAYVLIAAAYLHDAGMVVPPKEKAELLSSEEWRAWIETGGGERRWREVTRLREGSEPSDPALRHFLADLETRFLIAEFIRSRHSLRAANVISQHQASLGRFAFDDPMLQRTISDVCVGHGLRGHELEDKEHYPDQRDVIGQQMNVRFVTILLRLGDLLDMSSDRACPLLLNAANPLPAESLAHWSQYQRITHRLTTPERIEITAECQTQDEHRFLQDWCQWIVDEVANARTLMIRANRHQRWTPPVAAFEGSQPTIVIRPSSDASYVPSSWHFEFDRDEVLNRLIYDVYDSPAAFISELIQNALDATRCQMYIDMMKEGEEAPLYPTEVDEGRRGRYPISVKIEESVLENALSGETESKQVLVIEDNGIGMDREVIERYFLQIGRSFYTTDVFRRTFRFSPTSRFGVGFLSVFSASDRVIVDTFKPSSPNGDDPIHLTLTGPRNYLLWEHSYRRRSGTRIEVQMREQMAQGQLTELVRRTCRMVEFPIYVDDFGTDQVVEAERSDQFTYEIPDVTKEGAKFILRSFPVERPGIEGNLYVLAHSSESGESWAKWDWSQHSYPRSDPQATSPSLPESITCVNGILVGRWSGDRQPTASRLDYRDGSDQVTLGRHSLMSQRLLRRAPLEDSQSDNRIESR